MVLLDTALHLIYDLPIGALRPLAPSVARLAQIMVPTPGGPCRAPSASQVTRYVDASCCRSAAPRAISCARCFREAIPVQRSIVGQAGRDRVSEPPTPGTDSLSVSVLQNSLNPLMPLGAEACGFAAIALIRFAVIQPSS
jgi:hypothetical protein